MALSLAGGFGEKIVVLPESLLLARAAFYVRIVTVCIMRFWDSLGFAARLASIVGSIYFDSFGKRLFLEIV